MERIIRSEGYTETEALLAKLCDKVFLKAWCYPNPYNHKSDEICDLLAIFGQHIFIFFDREKAFQKGRRRDLNVRWKRWKRTAIDAQVKTAIGAERYLKRGGKVYLDSTLSQELPIPLDLEQAEFHKIVVAHGADQACLACSKRNLRGSLAISYMDGRVEDLERPFLVDINRKDKVHLLDTVTLPILLRELDTVYDISQYLRAKENAMERLNMLVYCGEEDLLAHYFQNFDEESKTHFIGSLDEKFDSVMIEEGHWDEFYKSEVFKAREEANRISYFWDELLQKTCSNALVGTLEGNGNVFTGDSAINEMAMEPRFHRRALSYRMIKAIEDFPEEAAGFFRNLSIMPSFFPKKSYVFLQLKGENNPNEDEYRQKRAKLLEIACGTLKNKIPELDTIVGIAIDSPKHSRFSTEDFLLLRCGQWSNDLERYYLEQNKPFGFLSTNSLKISRGTVKEFPD